ncbi:uncharacterized protein METZ01_LOCUS144981 [marine metagenome]|uniref:Uncharacterized protein n=1 Tax=marine metagenome TaxID=408172 RepID=A0A381ZTK1_9ZZZZ
MILLHALTSDFFRAFLTTIYPLRSNKYLKFKNLSV